MPRPSPSSPPWNTRCSPGITSRPAAKRKRLLSNGLSTSIIADDATVPVACSPRSTTRPTRPTEPHSRVLHDPGGSSPLVTCCTKTRLSQSREQRCPPWNSAGSRGMSPTTTRASEVNEPTTSLRACRPAMPLWALIARACRAWRVSTPCLSWHHCAYQAIRWDRLTSTNDMDLPPLPIP